jgi:hypothetical protein
LKAGHRLLSTTLRHAKCEKMPKFHNLTAVPQVVWIVQRDALIFPANGAPADI